MARKYIDCRDHPGDVKRTVALSANSEEERIGSAAELESSMILRE